MTTKVYELYPCWGSFSVKTIDYQGTAYLVAATSVRQAYAVAHKDVWIDPDADHPVGIVSIYDRENGPTLWCGWSGHRVEGGQPEHGDGVRALRAAIESHNGHCPHHRLPLADRLRRHAEQANRQVVTE